MDEEDERILTILARQEDNWLGNLISDAISKREKRTDAHELLIQITAWATSCMFIASEIIGRIPEDVTENKKLVKSLASLFLENTSTVHERTEKQYAEEDGEING